MSTCIYHHHIIRISGLLVALCLSQRANYREQAGRVLYAERVGRVIFAYDI